MKKLKIYLDTSVISHLKADDAQENMMVTLKLWKEIAQGEYIVYISELVLDEVRKCSEPKRSIMLEYLTSISFIEIELAQEISLLAQKYIREDIIPVKYSDDAIHIAAATVYGCNVVVSWNFKHMVKLKTIIGVNGVNKYMGYSEIEILPPNSIIKEED